MPQDTFHSDFFGELTFVELKKNFSGYDICAKCLLKRLPEECHKAPCTPAEREDKRNGYYSVHQMPEN